jgi:hypothetical protein
VAKVDDKINELQLEIEFWCNNAKSYIELMKDYKHPHMVQAGIRGLTFCYDTMLKLQDELYQIREIELWNKTIGNFK